MKKKVSCPQISASRKIDGTLKDAAYTIGAPGIVKLKSDAEGVLSIPLNLKGEVVSITIGGTQ